MAQTDPNTARIKEFRASLPNDCQTAIVMDRGAPPAIVRMFAASEGFHALANVLFQLQHASESDDGGAAALNPPGFGKVLRNDVRSRDET